MSDVVTDQIRVSVFPGVRSRHPQPHTLTWEQMGRRFGRVVEAPPGEAKSDQRLWSPTVYREGATRGAANVEAVTCLVMDYDDGTSIGTAHRTWSDVAHIIHTSWSHTPEHHKFRVVVPLSRPCPAALWPRLWAWAHRRAPQIDRACKDASRMYYLPVCPPGSARFAEVHDGPWLDVDPSRLSEPTSEARPRREPMAAGAMTPERRTLTTDEGARRWAAEALGADIIEGPRPRAEQIPCPSCGRPSVWFYIAPGSMAGAECDHEQSCGWRGHIDELVDPSGIPVGEAVPDEVVTDPVRQVERLALRIGGGECGDREFSRGVTDIARAITPDIATDLAGSASWTLALGSLSEAARGCGDITGATSRIKSLLVDVVKQRAMESDSLAFGAASGAEPEVLEHLDIREKDNSVLPTLLNITRILHHDSRWSGRLRYNEFALAVEVDGRPIADHTETEVALWIAEHYGVHVPTTKVGEAIDTVARRSTYHEVRDWLDGLDWDGHERIHDLLPVYFDAERSEVRQAIARRWMISAVARVMPPGTGYGNSGGPGCKVDTMMVLVGEQGARKSSGLKALCGAKWFRDNPLNIGHSADPFMQLRGAWIYEAAEVDGWNRREQAEIKNFLSIPVDFYRPSYGRHVIEQPRQCVFAGTTNREDFLSDPTGSRRYWPVTVGQVNVDALRRDREQLWAEAVAAYRCGEPWHLTESESLQLIAESDKHRESDAWEVAIIGFADRYWHLGLTAADLLTGAVRKKPSDIQKRDEMRVAKIMAAAGWNRTRLRTDSGARPTVWHPSDDPPPDTYQGWTPARDADLT